MARLTAASKRQTDVGASAPPSRRRSSYSRPTARGWFFLAASVGCAIVAYASGRIELLYAAGLLLLLPVAGLVVVRIRPLRLTVTRRFSPSVVTAGRQSTVELDIRNISSFSSAPASWVDRIPWHPGTAGPGSLGVLAPNGSAGDTTRGSSIDRGAMRARRLGEAAEVEAAAVGRAGVVPKISTARSAQASSGSPVGRATGATNRLDADRRPIRRLGYTLRPTSRGVFTIGPLEVEYTDPFGLGVSHISVGGEQTLYVVPPISPLGNSGPIFVSGDGTARLIQRTATGSDDDLMTREYRSGDALRRVHWRASARHGELMVRQEEQRSFPEARLLIDTRLDGYGESLSRLGIEDDGHRWFEWGVRMIGSVGIHLHRSGFLVQIIETGPAQIAPLGDATQGSGQDSEFLLSLAGVRMVDPVSLARVQDNARAQNTLGPIFAVVADPAPDALAWIIAQRRAYESGVVFVLDTGADYISHAFVNAGWTCVPVRDTDDPAVVWARVAAHLAPAPAEQTST